MWSCVLCSVSLPEEPPSAPAQNVIASGRTNQSIMIQWQPPPESHQNGILRGYTVRWDPFFIDSFHFYFFVWFWKVVFKLLHIKYKHFNIQWPLQSIKLTQPMYIYIHYGCRCTLCYLGNSKLLRWDHATCFPEDPLWRQLTPLNIKRI